MNFNKMTPEQLEALPANTIVCNEHGYTFEGLEDDSLREFVAEYLGDEWTSMTEGEKRAAMVDWVSPPPSSKK